MEPADSGSNMDGTHERQPSALGLIDDDAHQAPPDRSTTPVTLGAEVGQTEGHPEHAYQEDVFAFVTGDYSGNLPQLGSDDERSRAAAVTPERFLRHRRHRGDRDVPSVGEGTKQRTRSRRRRRQHKRTRRRHRRSRSSRSSRSRSRSASRSRSRSRSASPTRRKKVHGLPKLPLASSSARVLRAPLLPDSPASARLVSCAVVTTPDATPIP